MPVALAPSVRPRPQPHFAPSSLSSSSSSLARTADALPVSARPSLAKLAGVYEVEGAHSHRYMVVSVRDDGALRIEGKYTPPSATNRELPFADTFEHIDGGPVRRIGRDGEGGHYDFTVTTTSSRKPDGAVVVQSVDEHHNRGSRLQPWRKYIDTTTLTFANGRMHHHTSKEYFKRSFGFFGDWLSTEATRGNKAGTIYDVTYRKIS